MIDNISILNLNIYNIELNMNMLITKYSLLVNKIWQKELSLFWPLTSKQVELEKLYMLLLIGAYRTVKYAHIKIIPYGLINIIS